jgi:hypothetical protein
MQREMKWLGWHQWCKILIAATLGLAVILMLLRGWMSTGQHEHISKQELNQGALKIAMEEWGGLVVSISDLVSYAGPCMSFVCMLLKAHAWHLWRVLFGWLKLKYYRTAQAAKYWILFGWLIALGAQI